MNASSNFTKISFPLPQPPWNHHKQREKDRGVATIFVPKDEFPLRLTENSKYFRFYPREKVGNRAVSESSFFFSISIEWQTVEQRCLSARLRKRGRLFRHLRGGRGVFTLFTFPSFPWEYSLLYVVAFLEIRGRILRVELSPSPFPSRNV